MSATVERAIREMYDRDTVDENIILARQATLERKMGLLDKKLETIAGLLLYTLLLIFARLPKLPSDKGDRQTVLDLGTKRTEEAVNGYRRHTAVTGLSFMQSVYGVLEQQAVDAGTVQHDMQQHKGAKEHIGGRLHRKRENDIHECHSAQDVRVHAK